MDSSSLTDTVCVAFAIEEDNVGHLEVLEAVRVSEEVTVTIFVTVRIHESDFVREDTLRETVLVGLRDHEGDVDLDGTSMVKVRVVVNDGSELTEREKDFDLDGSRERLGPLNDIERSLESVNEGSLVWVSGVRVTDPDELLEAVTVADVVGVRVGWSELLSLRPSREYDTETVVDPETSLVAVPFDKL